MDIDLVVSVAQSDAETEVPLDSPEDEDPFKAPTNSSPFDEPATVGTTNNAAADSTPRLQVSGTETFVAAPTSPADNNSMEQVQFGVTRFFFSL